MTGTTFFGAAACARNSTGAARRRASVLIVAAALFTGHFGFAVAQPSPTAAKPPQLARQPAVVVELTQFKVVKAGDGKESLVDASSVKPGDIVEYRATYANRSGQPVNGLVATLPVPGGTEYLAKSAFTEGHAAEAATVDGRYAAEPLTRAVSLPDGTHIQPVPYAEYRSLRWRLGQLAAGAKATVKARVMVSAAQAAAANDAHFGASAPEAQASARVSEKAVEKAGEKAALAR